MITLYRPKAGVVAVDQHPDGTYLLIDDAGRKRTLTPEELATGYEPAEHGDVQRFLQRALPPGRGEASAVTGRPVKKRSGRRCPNCDKLCASIGGLAVHRARAHKATVRAKPASPPVQASAGPHRCDRCGRTFAAAAGLGRHRVSCRGKAAGRGGLPDPFPIKTPKMKDNLSGRARIALTKCPSCGAYTLTDPCERCHTKVAPGAIGQK